MLELSPCWGDSSPSDQNLPESNSCDLQNLRSADLGCYPPHAPRAGAAADVGGGRGGGRPPGRRAPGSAGAMSLGVRPAAWAAAPARGDGRQSPSAPSRSRQRQRENKKLGKAVAAPDAGGVHSAPGAPGGLREYMAVISALRRSSAWREAVKTLETMARGGLEPDAIAHCAAMAACERAGQWQPALDVLGRMRGGGVPLDRVTYGVAVSSCARGDRWERAAASLREMGAVGVEADIQALNAAVSACQRGAQWGQALHLVEAMAGRGLSPDRVTLSTVMSACERGGHSTIELTNYPLLIVDYSLI